MALKDLDDEVRAKSAAALGKLGDRRAVPYLLDHLLSDPAPFVRARIAEGTSPNAILVPQRGVARDATGRPTVLVVDAQNKVERRVITTDRAVGDAWLVTGISNPAAALAPMKPTGPARVCKVQCRALASLWALFHAVCGELGSTLSRITLNLICSGSTNRSGCLSK